MLVRGLSRNAFINIPQYQQQDSQQQQYYWQLPPSQQQQSHSYHLNNSFEQQYQFQQQFLSKVQRRGVAGSQPDISRCSINNINNSSGANPASLAMTPLSQFSHLGGGGGGGGGGPPNSSTSSPHQVTIDMSPAALPSATTSPQTTRRLLPRIITKKTDNSTVVLVGETRTPGKPPFNSTATTASPYSYPDSLSTSYISAASGGGGWRPSEASINRNELFSSQILSNSSCAASTTTPKKTDSTDTVHKDHNVPLVASGADGGVGSGGVPSLGSTNATTKTTSASSHPPTKLISKGKVRKSYGATPTDSSTQQEKGARNNKVRLKNVPSYISAHYRNAPITKLSHPLEENIFSSLFITLFAVAIAIIVGVPILCGVGIIVIGVVGIRYMIAVIHGVASYMRFICSRWQFPTNSRSFPPKILPRDRLAFANDVRWLGKKRRSRCQSIIHTLLVFEGSMDVTTCRHLIQTRVLRAETPQGELAYPRLLQKLVSVTSGYLWELDLTFDIQNHIVYGPTHFKSEKQLQHYIGRLLVQDLPLSRPLWEIRLLPSYYGSGKDTMAILRIHQCLADGMSLIRILSHSLADHQLMHVPQRPHFAGMSFGFNLLRSLIVGPLTIFLWWFTTFRDRNMFSVPLPKLHKNRRRRMLWWSWLCRNPLKWFRGHASASFTNGHGVDEEDKVSFTSSLGSSSSLYSSSESSNESDNGSEHSSHSVASGANKRRGKKIVQAFSNSPAQSSSKDDELTKGSSSNAQNTNQQNTPSHETAGSITLQQDQGEPSSSKSTKSSQGFERILPRNLNKCFGKKLSASKSSLQSQQDQLSGQGIKKERLTTGVATSGGGGSSDNPNGTRKKKNTSHKKKRKRRNGGHHHHHRRRRLFGGGRKTSLASNSSGSSFNSSSSSSTGTSYSSPTSGGSSRPAAWNVVWSAPMTLPKVARVKQIMRSSYNDVLLSAAAGSIRMYMQDQGTPYPGDVQVVIPVDLRNDIASPKHSNRLGCKVSSVLATIPSGMESAIPRLWATRHRLDELKASADSVVAYGATTILMNMLPHRIAIPILESIVNKASLQFSNLPGPTSTVVIGGYPLKGIYPIYPPPGRLRAAISVLTYADQVHITVVTHRSLLNAGPKLMRGMTEQMEQLSRQLSQRRVPGESRRSTRNFNQGNAEITKPPTRQIHLQLQIVQEELAQLNSQLEAQGIILSDEEYGFLTGSSGRRIISSLSQQQQQLFVDSGAGGQYHHQHYHQHHHGHHPQHHHYHHHLPVSQEQTSSTGIEEPTPSTSQSTSTDLSPAGQIELQNRLKSLKNEFAQLIGELRRRSSIVEGIAMSFEDAENEEEYRKPRKRALSVVSMTRRSSIFSSRSNATPDSPCYSSDDELPSSPQTDSRHQPQSTGSGQIATSASSSSTGYPTPTPNIRHSTSPMRTTAV